MVLSLFLFFLGGHKTKNLPNHGLTCLGKRLWIFTLKFSNPGTELQKEKRLTLERPPLFKPIRINDPSLFEVVLPCFASGITHLGQKKTWVAIKLKPLHNMTACNPTNLNWFPTMPAAPNTKCVSAGFFHEKKQGNQQNMFLKFKHHGIPQKILNISPFLAARFELYGGKCLYKMLWFLGLDLRTLLIK